MNKKIVWIAALLLSLVVSSANASSIWEANDGNVNLLIPVTTDGVTFGLFASSDTGFTSPLAELLGGSAVTVGISQPFIVAADIGGSWQAETGFTLAGGNSYIFSFNDGVSLFLADIAPVTVPVPEPETFLLMLLGLAALISLRRRTV